MNIKKIIFILAALPYFTFTAPSACRAEDALKFFIFYSPGCHKCGEVKNEIMPGIEKKFAKKISVEYRDISDLENYRMLLALRDKFSPGLKIEVPVFFAGSRMINSSGLTRRSLEDFIFMSLSAPDAQQVTGAALPKADLLSYFKQFKLAAVLGLGLVDGVNPCAFTVIVFFVSFLALQGYLRRELVIIGMCFIAAVFITYVLIGAGAFAFLYRLNKFWTVSRAINYAIGIFSIFIGGLALRDYFKFKATGQTAGLALQLPKPVKDRIHMIVGKYYRVNKNLPAGMPRKHLVRLAVSALITGFLISLLEAVCTGQTYLPTIAFILKTTQFKAQAMAYLLAYNLMFIVPLLAIFIFALLGVTSGTFSKILKKHLLLIKALMAVLFFALGIFLLWRA